jgi:hypothetical protein
MASFITVLAISPPPALAKTLKPETAFQSLVQAREELTFASQKYKNDTNGMRDYFSNPSLNMNKYEENANALLSSKQLDAESKVAIGTIRRYGVGADVIIMYGSVKAELEGRGNEEDDDMGGGEEDSTSSMDEEKFVNVAAVRKSLKSTMDSLDEVIAICKSNGF